MNNTSLTAGYDIMYWVKLKPIITTYDDLCNVSDSVSDVSNFETVQFDSGVSLMVFAVQNQKRSVFPSFLCTSLPLSPPFPPACIINGFSCII